MAISIDGTGTITGVSVGGLPDGIVDSDTLAPNTAGRVIQVVHVVETAYTTGSTIMPIDNTIPQITEGTEFMSLAITPTSATNKLLITVNAVLAPSTSDWITGALFQDSSTDAIASWSAYQSEAGGTANCNFNHYMTAGTTSETTFKFRAGQGLAGTTYINGNSGGGFFNGTCASTMTITEIVA